MAFYSLYSYQQCVIYDRFNFSPQSSQFKSTPNSSPSEGKIGVVFSFVRLTHLGLAQFSRSPGVIRETRFCNAYTCMHNEGNQSWF